MGQTITFALYEGSEQIRRHNS